MRCPGVVDNGEARTYRIRVMRGTTEDVVNDGVPVSVLDRDLSDRVRALAGRPGAEPLPIRVAGMMDGGPTDKIRRVVLPTGLRGHIETRPSRRRSTPDSPRKADEG